MSKTKTLDSGMPGVSSVDLEVASFREPFEGRALLDQLVRRGARQMLQQAIEAEVQEFLDQHQERRDEKGNRLVVRNGHRPSRTIVTGAGPLFSEALAKLLGEPVQGLSPNVIVRLQEQWTAEYEQWQRRDLTGKHYVYIWADGIYVNVRLEDTENQRQCLLVVMGRRWRVARSCSRSGMAITRVSRVGGSCWSTCGSGA
jgi:transposase-like protein